MEYELKYKLDVVHCKNCIFYKQHGFDLSKGEEAILNQNKTEVIYRQGETIVKQGAFSKDIFFIKGGLLKLYIESCSGKDLILRMVDANNFIGFPAFDTIEHYTFTAQALKNSVICVIRKEALETIAEENHSFTRYLNSWFIEDYKFLYHKMSSIASKQMTGRLADAILYISQKKFLDQNIFEYITRRDLADLAGMSVESMNKILNEFKAASIIDTIGKSIKILDYEMLDKLSKYG